MPKHTFAFPRCHSPRMPLAIALSVVGVITTLAAAATRADPVEVINAMRAEGCARGSSPAPPLRHDNSLEGTTRRASSRATAVWRWRSGSPAMTQ